MGRPKIAKYQKRFMDEEFVELMKFLRKESNLTERPSDRIITKSVAKGVLKGGRLVVNDILKELKKRQ